MNALAPGSVELFAGHFTPRTFLPCSGKPVAISVYPALFSILGTRFGGNGRTTFGLPDIPDLKTETGAGIEYTIEVDGMPGEGGGFGTGFGAGIIGEIVYFAGDFAPRGFVACDGAAYPTNDFVELFNLIGYKYGGHNDQFNVPKIDPLVTPSTGGKVSAYIRVNELTHGAFPYLATLMLWPGGEIPGPSWKFCDGQEIQISANPALFSLIGNFYGRDSDQTFNLPKLGDNADTKYVICTQGAYPARS